MSIAVHQVGAIGTVFIFTVLDQDGVIVNLATATKLDAKFRAGPKATTKVFSLPDTALFTDGTDGKFMYVTAAVNDLDVDHLQWVRQGDVIIPGLYTGHTQVRTFPVFPNL
ncbi:MAG: hypothetical protein IH885_10460 [Myxococcales bacterium]|nr:hypothetical protein [Myxococcales bacterium]